MPLVTEKPTWKSFLPTIIMAIIAVVVEIILPWTSSKESFSLHWYDFVGVFITAVASFFKQDDNPVRFWDSTWVGAIIGAVTQWLVLSFATKPPTFEIKTLVGLILPPLIVLATSFARGFGKGYNSPEGGT